MKKFLAIVIACIAVLGLAYVIARYYLPIYGIKTPVSDRTERREYKTMQVEIGEARYQALVADTQTLRANGLSGFKSLAYGQAMLFIFPNAGSWGFWMREMNFPIDMVWIGDDLRVVTVKANAEPASYPDVFYPAAPARYVLEVPAGDAARFRIVSGGKVSF